MFYGHFEGRKRFAIRCVEDGLRAAVFNLAYPPDEDQTDAVADRGAEMLINPQAFRLAYPPSTWNPKLHLLLDQFGQLEASDLADIDASGRVTSLTRAARDLCDAFLAHQEAYGATDVIAPYFHARSVSDPFLEISLSCAHYLDGQTAKHVFAGLMLDSALLNTEVDFDILADLLSSPSRPDNYYLDLSLNSSPKRPLRDAGTLSRLRTLFSALSDADKFSLLARCNTEGLLLRAATSLDAFSSSYYQTERQGLHRHLELDYEQPPAIRAPTPFIFSRDLLTDVPRPLAQRLIRSGRSDLLTCECAHCAEMVSDAELSRAGILAPAHYMLCITALDDELDEEETVEGRARVFYEMLESAEDVSQRIGRAAVPAGTFTHLAAWRSWLEDEFGFDE